jgi:hypothetical protein
MAATTRSRAATSDGRSPPASDRQDASARSQALTLRLGPLEVDIPESLGYFGGIWLAVALELIEPPLGLFIAAVPFVKMLDLPQLPLPATFLGHIVQGAAKPVGSDADGTIRIHGDDS